MASSLLDRSFFGYKSDLLNNPSVATNPELLKEEKTSWDAKVNDFSYAELLENHSFLELELNSVKTLLESKKLSLDAQQEQKLWLYCYGLGQTLSKFYNAYSDTVKKAKLKEVLKTINGKLGEPSAPDEKLNFFHLKTEELRQTLTQTSKIRAWLEYSNLRRLYWVFCRLALVRGFLLAKSLNIMERLDLLLGKHTDIDKIVDIMQSPNGILNYFSVGLFLGRLVIDASLWFRHTFIPNQNEGEYCKVLRARFMHEFWKRHTNVANDIAWSVVNLLTNFRFIVGPTADYLVAGFLGFDVLMISYKLKRAYNSYCENKAMYDGKINTSMGVEKSFYEKQLHELEINWQVQKASFAFAIAGATLLMLGYTASFIFSPPGMIVASYFMCVLAAAIYLSGDNFADYQKEKLRLQDVLADPNSSKELKVHAVVAQQKNQTKFALELAWNAIVPSLMIATVAIYWPAAVSLVIAYGSYQLLWPKSNNSSTTPSTSGDECSTSLEGSAVRP